MIGRQRRTLGMDLSPTSLKFVTLSKNRERLYVEQIAVQDWGSLQDESIEEALTTDILLRQITVAQKLSKFDTVMNIPDSDVFTDEISLPQLPANEMGPAILNELGERLPYPPEEAVIDHLVVGSEKHPEHIEQKVRAFCALEARVVDLHRSGTVAGLRLTSLEPDLSANLAVLAYNEYITPDSTNLLLDIGGSKITLALISKKRLLYCSTLSNGLNQINNDLSVKLGIDNRRAEELKNSYSMIDLDQAPTDELAVIDERIYDILYRIEKLVGYLGGILKEESIESLLLMGGGACIEGMDKILGDMTKVPALIVNPFKNIDLHRRGKISDDKIASQAPKLSVAVGLALKGMWMADIGRINLLPQHLRPKPVSLREHPALKIATGGLATLSLIGLCTHQTISASRAEAELAQLELQHKKLTAQVAQITGEQKILQEQGQIEKNLIQLALGKTLWSQVFKTLSLAAPEEVWLNQLTQTELPNNNRKLLLVGESPSQTSMAALMKSLENSPHFTEVTLKFSEQLEGFSPTVFRFQVECILVAPKNPEARRG